MRFNNLSITAFVIALFGCSAPSVLDGEHTGQVSAGEMGTLESNDVDYDGVSDTWETSDDGIAHGAQMGRKDVFFHIDWSYCTNSTGGWDKTQPGPLSRDGIRYILKTFRDGFGSKSWCAHIDNGETIWDCDDLSKDGSKVWFNEARRSLARARMVTFVKDASGNRSDQLTYDKYFPIDRARRFHYGIVGCGGGGESSKWDLIPSFGNSGDALIHEFGHRWLLDHGGNEDVNGKPNYHSVMSYALSYAGTGFSALALPTLNEFDVCETNGLKITLSKKTEVVGGVKIPVEYKPLVLGGMPVKLIRENGAIDWNGDGVIDYACTKGIKEANLELGFEGWRGVMDTGSVRVNANFTASPVDLNGRLWVIYRNAAEQLAATRGPNDLTSFYDELAENDDPNQALFGSETLVSYSGIYGSIASEPSVVAKGGKAYIYFATTSGAIVMVAVDAGAGGDASSLSTASTAAVHLGANESMGSLALCTPTAAYDPKTGGITIIARVCDTNEVHRITGPWTSTSLGVTSTGRPGAAFDANGNLFVFGARPSDATHACSQTEDRLYVVRVPLATGGAPEPSKWVWDPTNSCGHQAAVVSGTIGVVFDPSPKRSKSGRFYVFFKGKQPDPAIGVSTKMNMVHYDLEAQKNNAGLKAIQAPIDGPQFDWNEKNGSPNGYWGAAVTAIPTMFGGRAIMVHPQSELSSSGGAPGSRHGVLVLSPADGIIMKALKGFNDAEALDKQIPLSIKAMPIPAETAPAWDTDGDGIPNWLDTCGSAFEPGNSPDACDLTRLGPDGNGNGIADAYDGLDQDGDGILDSVDADVDGDIVCDVLDPKKRPKWCLVIDNCPYTSNPTQSLVGLDDDGDGVCDEIDNCVLPAKDGVSPSFNPSQVNSSSYGAWDKKQGDACDVGAKGRIDAAANSGSTASLDVAIRVWGAHTNDPALATYLDPIQGEAALGVCLCAANACANCGNQALGSVYENVKTWAETFTRQTTFKQVTFEWAAWLDGLGKLKLTKCGMMTGPGNLPVPIYCKGSEDGLKLRLFTRKTSTAYWSALAGSTFVNPKLK